MGSMTRSQIEAIVTKWERWAASEMWIAEHLHPRAKTALVTELTEAISTPQEPKPPAKGRK